MLCPRLQLSNLALLFLMIGTTREASYGPRVISCWKNWLKMTDNNYLRALERYDNCGKLVGELTSDARDKFKKSLIENLQRSSNYFFDHTEMSPVEVIRVLRSANRLMLSFRKDPVPSSDYTSVELKALRTPKHKDGSESCLPLLPCDKFEEDEEDDDCEPCSDRAVSLLKWTRMLLYAFIALIAVQSLLLIILFCKVCCTDLLTHFPSCSYETECCCEEDKEWITKLIRQCESHLTNKQETYPLLLDIPAQKSKSVTAVCYGTNIGKRRNRDDEILTDLTPLSSPRIGSDSEFEALMNRKPIKKP